MESKEEKYRLLAEQVKALTEGEDNAVGVMANVTAAIHQTMGFFWTGFYFVVGRELHLGPFQGPVACYRIPFGKGVCGTAWQREATVVVPDVELFPGHIACSSLSRSEIVVPICQEEGSVVAVLDIDSKEIGTFDAIDQYWLEHICKRIAPILASSGRTEGGRSRIMGGLQLSEEVNTAEGHTE